MLGCRLSTVDEYKTIDIASSISIPSSDTAKEDDSVDVVDAVSQSRDEFSNWSVKLRLWNLDDRLADSVPNPPSRVAVDETAVKINGK
ncbi:hypothetical protein HALLA_01040 (plasmid) [Halostagnicola larsenii XH-48]|uniref:Uncharacterized protein n=1 Tax=Halostagnicola larsenii XH-48 TaxID=797299 RepID=W0JTG0_9EURY|nr:hypothetical protein HALLA_01040 [Halostagnicola larsenii XH-48]